MSFAFTDLVFSTDDECKLPPHSREVNKYPKHKTYSKNRRNGTVVVNSVCKSVCIKEDFLSTKNKKKKNQFPRVMRMTMEHISGKE